MANPTYPTDAKTYQSYHDLMGTMMETVNDMHRRINTTNDYKKQIKRVLKELSTSKKHQALKSQGEALLKQISNWDKEMIQRKSKAYDDVENFPNKLTANYLFMINQAESDIPKIIQPVLDRKIELDKEWEVLKRESIKIMEKDVPAFNQSLWKAGIGAILLKE